MTTVLALDCATGPCSVAIWHDNRIAAYTENLKPVMQSASLVPMTEAALAQSGLTYPDITLVAATVGPGSFTGIRVALAAAKGIAYAAGIKSIGFTTLDVLAFAAQKAGDNILSLLQAGKGECYYQYYTSSPHLKTVTGSCLGTLEHIIATAPGLPVTVAGNIQVNAEGFTNIPVVFPRADALAELAATAAISPQFPPHDLKPFYIRAPDAKLPAAKQMTGDR